VLELTLTGTDITDPLPAGIGGQPHASVFVTKSNANNGGVHIDYIGYDFEERYGR